MKRQQKGKSNSLWKTLGKLLALVVPLVAARQGRKLGGSSTCKCPKCGYIASHVRGTPCSSINCPKCGTSMRGAFCL